MISRFLPIRQARNLITISKNILNLNWKSFTKETQGLPKVNPLQKPSIGIFNSIANFTTTSKLNAQFKNVESVAAVANPKLNAELKKVSDVSNETKTDKKYSVKEKSTKSKGSPFNPAIIFNRYKEALNENKNDPLSLLLFPGNSKPASDEILSFDRSKGWEEQLDSLKKEITAKIKKGDKANHQEMLHLIELVKNVNKEKDSQKAQETLDKIVEQLKMQNESNKKVIEILASISRSRLATGSSIAGILSFISFILLSMYQQRQEQMKEQASIAKEADKQYLKGIELDREIKKLQLESTSKVKLAEQLKEDLKDLKGKYNILNQERSLSRAGQVELMSLGIEIHETEQKLKELNHELDIIELYIKEHKELEEKRKNLLESQFTRNHPF